MADLDDKLADNVPGKWYVDSNCIDCDVCRTTAPNNFEANEDEGYSLEESMESCPTEAIGDDGS